MPAREAIDQIFKVLLELVEAIDDYSEKIALKSNLPRSRREFDRLFSACGENNSSNDGIQAFQLIRNYIWAIQTRYERNPEIRKQETRYANKVAGFLETLCEDVCDMLRNTRQSTEKTYCTMIEETLAIYTPITFENVDQMQAKRQARMVREAERNAEETERRTAEVGRKPTGAVGMGALLSALGKYAE